MADFCWQCAEELFGWGASNDMLGLTEHQAKALYFVCEGCGFIQVDVHGRCQGGCAKKDHDWKIKLRTPLDNRAEQCDTERVDD